MKHILEKMRRKEALDDLMFSEQDDMEIIKRIELKRDLIEKEIDAMIIKSHTKTTS